MGRFAAGLVVIFFLVSLGQTTASPVDYADGHIGDLRPTISSKREALAWLERHSVTLTQFMEVTGRRPKVDRTGHRW